MVNGVPVRNAARVPRHFVAASKIRAIDSPPGIDRPVHDVRPMLHGTVSASHDHAAIMHDVFMPAAALISRYVA